MCEDAHLVHVFKHGGPLFFRESMVGTGAHDHNATLDTKFDDVATELRHLISGDVDDVVCLAEVLDQVRALLVLLDRLQAHDCTGGAN